MRGRYLKVGMDRLVDQDRGTDDGKYRNLFNSMVEGVVINKLVLDEKGNVNDYIIIEVNQAFEINSPYKIQNVLGKRATEIYHLTSEHIRTWLQMHVAMDSIVYTELFLIPSCRWYAITTTQLKGSYFYTIYLDITDSKRVGEVLLNNEHQLRDLINNLPDTIYIFDLENNNCLYLNNDEFYGYSKSLLDKQESIKDSLHPDDRAVVEANWDKMLESNNDDVYSIEYRTQAKNGAWEWVHQRIKVHTRSADGSPNKVLITLSIITKRKHEEEKLKFMSTHDVLTGLYNRSYFEEEMNRYERGRSFPISILMADVDKLKETNDRDGHSAGDALLKLVARALTSSFRSEDVLARIGGDEFAALLPSTDETSAQIALSRVRQVIEENNTYHPENPINISIGISTAVNPMALTDLMKEADANMYLDKRRHHH